MNRHRVWRTVVRLYKRRFQRRAQAELDWYGSQPSLREAVERAALATDERGKRFAHQRRLSKATLKEARRLLLANLWLLEASATFNDLFEHVRGLVSPIRGIGELYVYDTSLRIGARLHLMPKSIYLHAGTRVGARALGFSGRELRLPVSRMPPEFQGLAPREIEDVLCIFKKQLQASPPERGSMRLRLH